MDLSRVVTLWQTGSTSPLCSLIGNHGIVQIPQYRWLCGSVVT